MNDYQGPGPTFSGLIIRVLLLAVAAVIVLSIVVSVIKALWPWMVGLGLVAAAGVALVRLRGRDSTRW